MMKAKSKRKLTDNEIGEYCQSVEKLLKAINERHEAKKSKKAMKAEEDYITENEDILVLS